MTHFDSDIRPKHDPETCRSIITIQSPSTPIAVFRCEKPLRHTGSHYITFEGGGMAWPDPPHSTWRAA